MGADDNVEELGGNIANECGSAAVDGVKENFCTRLISYVVQDQIIS